MNKTYHIVTFGCQMNENDSEKLAGILDNMGYKQEDNIRKADIVIINTCSVRETADQRAFGNIGQIKTYKKENPKMVLAVCGCMMQQQKNVDYLHQKHPEVDIIFGTHNIERFPELLRQHSKNNKPITEILQESIKISEDIPVHHKYNFKSYVTIMEGCNNFCSYCIVPYTRGRERSRKPEKILEEVKKLVQNGCLEITLLGQNVNSYGKDLEDNINFAFLLNALQSIPGLRRIRFMSSNPKDFTDEVIHAIKVNSKVMPSIHLALQSGSTRILKRMNRHYTKEDALNLIQKIKQEIPDISITTDIIVGFPGETEEDFLETVDLVRQVHFDSAFSFIYSKREGTLAAKMTDQVDEKIKHERIMRLNSVLKEEALKRNQMYLDKVYEVLVEEKNNKNPHLLSGRTESGKLVHFPGEQTLIGQIVPVRIIKTGAYSLRGELVKEECDGVNTNDGSVLRNA